MRHVAPENSRAYGDFIAKRFARFPNLMWMHVDAFRCRWRDRTVKGHEFGFDVSPEDRKALIAFLKTG